jgi:predicted DNA-binding ribbon-helix-helix protein
LKKEFWDSLREIAVERGMSLGALVAAIDLDRQHANLSSAIRIFVLRVYRDRSTLNVQTRKESAAATPEILPIQPGSSTCDLRK